uniref:Guanylate-binding protein N-terminal domain-containing protein n=1 Tax=Strigamia maritima TaxID=126957 RepID=T1IGX8_STRMM
MQKNDLNHLHLCTENGLSALGSENLPGFKKLVLLIRDWEHRTTHECGFAGGEQYMNNYFFENMTKHDSQVEQSLRSSFTDITCFLMSKHMYSRQPEGFAGQLNLLEEDFLLCLDKLIPRIVKNVKENTVLQTGSQLFSRFVTSFETLKNMAPIVNRIDSQNVSYNRTAHNLAVAQYCKSMTDLTKDDTIPIDPKILREEIEKAVEKAVRLFKETKRMGRNACSAESVERLKKELDLHGRIRVNDNDRLRTGELQRK